MILCHGTTAEILRPEIKYANKFLDFGPGIYFTTFKIQAENWAGRKALRKQEAPIVNVYQLADVLEGYRQKRFHEEDEEWLDFVCNCRKGKPIYENYDIIFGSVADDKVFKVVDLYFRGIWEKERALSELKYYNMNNQICILNQQLMENELQFIESYEVK